MENLVIAGFVDWQTKHRIEAGSILGKFRQVNDCASY